MSTVDCTVFGKFLSRLGCCKKYVGSHVLYSHKTALMGGAPYMLTEQGSGRSLSLSVSAFNPERVLLTFVYVHQAQAAASSKSACIRSLLHCWSH